MLRDELAAEIEPSLAAFRHRPGYVALGAARADEVPDVVEAAVAHALRQGCRVETFSEDGALAGLGGIGALLRF